MIVAFLAKVYTAVLEALVAAFVVWVARRSWESFRALQDRETWGGTP